MNEYEMESQVATDIAQMYFTSTKDMIVTDVL